MLLFSELYCSVCHQYSSSRGCFLLNCAAVINISSLLFFFKGRAVNLKKKKKEEEIILTRLQNQVPFCVLFLTQCIINYFIFEWSCFNGRGGETRPSLVDMARDGRCGFESPQAWGGNATEVSHILGKS